MKKLFAIMLIVCNCLIVFTGCANSSQENSIADKQYVYENEGVGGSFGITICADGTFTYHEGLYSSYIGMGNWTLDGDVLCLTDDEKAETSFVNYFKVDGDDLIFIAENSSGFLLVNVADGERFIGEPLPSSGQKNDDVGTNYFYGYYNANNSRYIISLLDDGTYYCWNMLYSSPSERGTWILDEDTVCLTGNEKDESSSLNYFKVDGSNLVFIEENSTGFSFMDIVDGARIIGSSAESIIE